MNDSRPPDDLKQAMQELPREEFLRLLYERHGRTLAHFFLKQGLSKEDTEDLIQETLVRVYKSMDSFRGDASVKTWLFRIATNLWINHLRGLNTAKRQGVEIPLEPTAGEASAEVEQAMAEGGAAPNPLSRALASEELRRVRDAVVELAPELRQPICLRALSDYTDREIGDILETPVGTVKSRLSRARRMLRSSLGAGYVGEEL